MSTASGAGEAAVQTVRRQQAMLIASMQSSLQHAAMQLAGGGQQLDASALVPETQLDDVLVTAVPSIEAAGRSWR